MTDDIIPPQDTTTGQAQQPSKDISEDLPADKAGKTEEAAPTGGQVKKVIDPPRQAEGETEEPAIEVVQPKEEPIEKIVKSPPTKEPEVKSKPTPEPPIEEKIEPEPKIIKTSASASPTRDRPPPEPPQPMGGQAKTSLSAPAQPKVIGIPESHPVIPFMTQFLDKLKEFRGRANEKRSENVENNLEKIMEFAKQNQKVTNDDVERITGVKDAQAQRYLKKLVESKKLVRFGKTSNIFYKPTK